MSQNTARQAQIQAILEAIHTGAVFTYTIYKAKCYNPPINADFRFDDDYMFTGGGVGHVCSAGDLIEHMEGHAELSAWVREDGPA